MEQIIASEVVAHAQGPIKIGFGHGTMNHLWHVAMVEGYQVYAAANLPDVGFIVVDGLNDSTEQMQDVESLIV